MTLNSQVGSLCVFFAIFDFGAHFKGELCRHGWKIDLDNLRTGTVKAVARLTRFAQIICLEVMSHKAICIPVKGSDPKSSPKSSKELKAPKPNFRAPTAAKCSLIGAFFHPIWQPFVPRCAIKLAPRLRGRISKRQVIVCSHYLVSWSVFDLLAASHCCSWYIGLRTYTMPQPAVSHRSV